MKRKANGMNIDEGIPLSEAMEFELLYADLYPVQAQQLSDWLNDKNDHSALALGGQIGSGKSTLLNKVAFTVNVETQVKPDIWLHFDQDSANPTAGDFIAIVLVGLINAILDNNLTFTNSSALIDDLLPEFDRSVIDEMDEQTLNTCWQTLSKRLNPSQKSLAAFQAKNTLIQTINAPQATEYFLKSIICLIDDFKLGTGRLPLIVASGIDKFPANGAAFFVLQDILKQIQNAKTLYEVNAIHLYAPQCNRFFGSMTALLLPRVVPENIAPLLMSRLGVYAVRHEKNVNILAQFSGGNPRQALRLLMHYLREKKNRNLTEQGVIAKAVKQTSVDYFSFASRPEKDLIGAVEKDQFLLSGMISRPGDASSALKAVYGNWIFLGDEIESDKREAIINPIVQGLFLDQSTPAEYMQSALNKYAEAQGISAAGLSFDDSTEHSRQLGFDVLFDEIDDFNDSNLADVFDEISASLLNKNRPDRAFIVYKDKVMSDAARAYLLAKSNTFEHQSYQHFVIDYAQDKSAAEEIDLMLSALDQNEYPIDILSFEFSAQWPVKQLRQLESKRDCFLDHQILWWVNDVRLKAILPDLVQLRQLFEVYSLDDTLLASLCVADIEADIDYWQSMGDKANQQPIAELKKVADYLSHAKEMHNDG